MKKKKKIWVSQTKRSHASSKKKNLGEPSHFDQVSQITLISPYPDCRAADWAAPQNIYIVDFISFYRLQNTLYTLASRSESLAAEGARVPAKILYAWYNPLLILRASPRCQSPSCCVSVSQRCPSSAPGQSASGFRDSCDAV